MDKKIHAGRPVQPIDIRPWYKEPWPWVAIAIPAAAVIMGIVTFYLAVSNPDHLVVDDGVYREIKSELRAQQPSESTLPDQETSPDKGNGEL
jgi:hypothetical protein